MQGISIREFARQEKCSDTLVRRALQQKRLAAYADGSLDPTLIGTAWCAKNAKGANSLHDVRSSRLTAREPKGLSYSEALRVKENYLAMLRRLEYEERSGSLIELATAEAVMFEMFRAQRDAWLSWPTKAAPLIADALGLTDIERLCTALTEQVYRQIGELVDAPEHAFDEPR